MISQAYAHKVESTLSDFGDHLEMLDRGLKALAAANEGMCAAINAKAEVDGDGMATLYDIVLADMKCHTDAMQHIITNLHPSSTQRA
ncbi:MAG: hypothetical protein ABL903_08575 [Methylococcales bacterium]